jgi:hypothetical protein
MDRRFEVCCCIKETVDGEQKPFAELNYHDLSYKSLVELESAILAALVQLAQNRLAEA